MFFEDMLKALGELGEAKNIGMCCAVDGDQFLSLPNGVPAYKHRVYWDDMSGHYLVIRPNSEGSYPDMPYMKRIR